MKQLKYWECLNALVLLGATAGYLYGGASFWWGLSGTAGLSFIALAAVGAAEWSDDYLFGGPANWVTWVRLGISLLLLFLMPTAPAWHLAGLGLLQISLDGCDGALARRYDTQSRYGAFFDAEVDAFFVLVMSLALYERGYAGSWILGMGLIRYLYLFPNLWLKPINKGEAGKRYARLIAGVVMVGMPVALIVPPWLYRWGLPVLGLLLAYSFNRELLERAGGRIQKD